MLTTSPCEYPLCPEISVPGSRFCNTHRLAKQLARHRTYAPGAQSSHRRFRPLRLAFLARHPVCASCQRAAATILDHVVPHRGDLNRFWDQSNWQALCKRCHDVKTSHGL